MKIFIGNYSFMKLFMHKFFTDLTYIYQDFFIMLIRFDCLYKRIFWQDLQDGKNI